MEKTTPKNPFAQDNLAKSTKKVTPSHPPIEERAFGPIIGIIIIIALLAFGALYFWGAHLQDVINPEAAQSDTEFYFDEEDSYETFLDDNNYEDTSFEVIEDPYTLSEFDIETDTFEAGLDDFSDIDTLDAEFESIQFEL